MAATALLLALGLAGGGCYRPSPPPRPRQNLPKLDFHTHYFRAPTSLVPLLEDWNMRAVLINYTNGESPDSVRRRWERMVALANAHPGRFILCTTIDPRGAGSPGFAARAVAQLRRDIEDGAELVKIWKDFGMEARGEAGQFLQVDDPRFQPIWDFLAAQRIPVIAHLADPAAAWQPIDSTSPHYWYYRDNPRYYAYAHTEMPSRAAILAAQDAWLRRNPQLTVIGAHLASMAEDLDSLSLRLDAFPNLSVDLAGRIKVLREEPKDRVRAWLLRYSGRVLYGSDMELDPVPAGKPTPAAAADAEFVHGRLLRDWEYLADTLAIPDSTLAQLMRRNAERVLAQADSARARMLGAPADIAREPSLSRPARSR
ncbi:MAG TPA: hypothetical protein VFS33_04140 [Gemmatimonadales bacterium]|nr:hypothetical protein [Gemmatimonadales bacterium]